MSETTKWAETLLHLAAHPDPVSMHCVVPAHVIESAAQALAAAERELEGVRRVEAWLRDRTISRFVDADRGRLAACENFVTKAPETRATADSLAALGHALPDTAQEGR